MVSRFGGVPGLAHAFVSFGFGDEHVVDVHIANLRRKIGDDPANPRYVLTLRGVGYRLGAGA